MLYIADFYPNKAQFGKQEPIDLSVELTNPTAEEKNLLLMVKAYTLCELIQQTNLSISLLPNEKRSVPLMLSPQNVEHEGYGVDIYLYDDKKLLDKAQTAFDVVDDWRLAPRYGFTSDFSPEDKGNFRDIQYLNKLHMNVIQFYDWMYRHEELIPNQPEFTDLMGRKLSYTVVKEKIQACHGHGMKAMAYGAIYAASNEFYQNHKDWGLYTSSGEVYDFINVFKIMNIAPDSPWHTHIINQYKNAVKEADFDGIHMDTYGYPKWGISKVKDVEKLEYLEEHFPPLIHHTRVALEEIKEGIGLIFNNVGNWPVDTVAQAPQDALYIEVWNPYERYHHLVEIIERAKAAGGNKPVILAAYLKPFTEMGDDKVKEAQISALILTAALAANGSYHMLLGGYEGTLTEGYYANYKTLDECFQHKIRNYYDFIVRFSSILFDRTMRNVSMTHTLGDNQEYVFEKAPISPYGEPGKVWVNIYENKARKAISFINLCGNESDVWNEGKQDPPIIDAIEVSIQVPKAPKAVYMVSPDGWISCTPLDYVLKDSPRGKVIRLRLSELKIWTLLVVDL